MSTRKQMGVAGGLVALALAVVVIYTGSTALGAGAAAEADGGMAGMSIGAPAAKAAQPVHLTPEAARRIGVTYATAEVRPFRRTLRTVASVTYDETRLAEVDPKVEGWVDRLFVDFTGAAVKKGLPLLTVYSPMLVTAQEELLLARRLVDESADAPSGVAAANARELLASARRRLAYWDIPADEITRIERSGVPSKTLTLRSPADGVVVEKNVVRGARIMPGMTLYRIADLSTVWVEGDVYEKDLSLVSVGQHARVTLDSQPGRALDGVVTYVYPTVSVESRTGRVRVALKNPGLALKPGMYAKISLAVAATSSLVVPRTAVLRTGERSLVFVRDARGMLQPRDVRVGLANDTLIEIQDGLAAGDVVVSSATFLIDAESNLGSAMASMPGMDMGAPGGGDSGAQAMPGMKTPATPAQPGDAGPTQDTPGMQMPAAPAAGTAPSAHPGH